MTKIKLKINHYTDREKIVSGLANSSIKTWIEEQEIPNESMKDYYVCFVAPKNSITKGEEL